MGGMCRHQGEIGQCIEGVARLMASYLVEGDRIMCKSFKEGGK